MNITIASNESKKNHDARMDLNWLRDSSHLSIETTIILIRMILHYLIYLVNIYMMLFSKKFVRYYPQSNIVNMFLRNPFAIWHQVYTTPAT